MKSEFVPLSPTGFLATIIAGGCLGAAFFSDGWALLFVALILLSAVRTDAREEIRNGLYERGRFGLMRRTGPCRSEIGSEPALSRQAPEVIDL